MWNNEWKKGVDYPAGETLMCIKKQLAEVIY